MSFNTITCLFIVVKISEICNLVKAFQKIVLLKNGMEKERDLFSDLDKSSIPSNDLCHD